jgi:hypothetical protein
MFESSDRPRERITRPIRFFAFPLASLEQALRVVERPLR